MLQESSKWDLRQLPRENLTSMRIFILFLFSACVVTSVKLIRVWIPAPPFRLSPQAGSSRYLQSLKIASDSLKQWIEITFLGRGIVAVINLTEVCSRLLDDKMTGRFVVLFGIRDFSVTLTMTLVVVLFLFLARWHILRRIEKLRVVRD